MILLWHQGCGHHLHDNADTIVIMLYNIIASTTTAAIMIALPLLPLLLSRWCRHDTAGLIKLKLLLLPLRCCIPYYDTNAATYTAVATAMLLLVYHHHCYRFYYDGATAAAAVMLILLNHHCRHFRHSDAAPMILILLLWYHNDNHNITITMLLLLLWGCRCRNYNHNITSATVLLLLLWFRHRCHPCLCYSCSCTYDNATPAPAHMICYHTTIDTATLL